MKHIKSFNEKFNLSKIVSKTMFGKDSVKDEETAEGILLALDKENITIDKMSDDNDVDYYIFNIDEFNIKVGKYVSLRDGGNYYILKIDDTNMNCTNNIMKKIWNAAKKISKSEESLTLKDAKLHFTNKYK